MNWALDTPLQIIYNVFILKQFDICRYNFIYLRTTCKFCIKWFHIKVASIPLRYTLQSATQINEILPGKEDWVKLVCAFVFFCFDWPDDCRFRFFVSSLLSLFLDTGCNCKKIVHFIFNLMDVWETLSCIRSGNSFSSTEPNFILHVQTCKQKHFTFTSLS